MLRMFRHIRKHVWELSKPVRQRLCAREEKLSAEETNDFYQWFPKGVPPGHFPSIDEDPNLDFDTSELEFAADEIDRWDQAADPSDITGQMDNAVQWEAMVYPDYLQETGGEELVPMDDWGEEGWYDEEDPNAWYEGEDEGHDDGEGYDDYNDQWYSQRFALEATRAECVRLTVSVCLSRSHGRAHPRCQ